MRKTLLSIALLAGISIFFTSNIIARGVGSANVRFGKPNEKQTSCDGKGICMLSSLSGSGEGTINVSFELLPEFDGSRDFVMSFNINDLTISDPTQANYFVDASGQPREDYNMDYTLTDRELCASLGVEPGELVITTRDHNVIEKLSDTQIRVTYRVPAK